MLYFSINILVRLTIWRSNCVLLLMLLSLTSSLIACESERPTAAIATQSSFLAATATVSKPAVMTTSLPLATTFMASVDVKSGTSASLLNTPTPINVATPINKPPSAGTITNPTISATWQSRWLKGIPCRPPCFEGITPGRSTASEALKLLQQNLLVADAEIAVNLNTGKQKDWIGWNWFDNPKSISSLSAGGGEVLFDDKTPSKIVRVIHPKLPAFTLNEVIQAYGEPSHVVATFERPFPEKPNVRIYQIYIFYLTQGFLLNTELTNVNSATSITATLSFEGLFFLVPGMDGIDNFRVSPTLNLKKLMVAWQGFKSFEFYCLAVNPQNEKCKD